MYKKTEINPLKQEKYPYVVIKQYPILDREQYLFWVFKNLPETDWKYSVYYINPNTEAIQVHFKDSELAMLFELSL